MMVAAAHLRPGDVLASRPACNTGCAHNRDVAPFLVSRVNPGRNRVVVSFTCTTDSQSVYNPNLLLEVTRSSR